ncbi:hypothetical protein PM082_016546 [Marasmius tenuissimus]|nr:hypothetical protein PM082_016546 [Marasmius tenuissimus]
MRFQIATLALAITCLLSNSVMGAPIIQGPSLALRGFKKPPPPPSWNPGPFKGGFGFGGGRD